MNGGRNDRVLDFDGVLTPKATKPSDDTDFCLLPRLEALLRECPHVRTVISPSWRERLSFETLLAPLSLQTSGRGCSVSRPNAASGFRTQSRCRQGEILAWPHFHGAADEPWVALDDAEWQFDRHQDQLVVCGSFVGFDARACATLRAHFERSRP